MLDDLSRFLFSKKRKILRGPKNSLKTLPLALCWVKLLPKAIQKKRNRVYIYVCLFFDNFRTVF